MSKSKEKGKKKQKKLHRPVTEVRSKAGLKKNSAKLIGKLHQLNKQKEFVSKDPKLTDHQKSTKLSELEKDIDTIGGVEVYQQLSKTAESRHGGFNSAKWVIKQIDSLKLSESKEGPLQLLDVGALDLNYKHHRKIVDCTAIDLNPQKTGIIKADFLTHQNSERGVYDIVVLSLVLNFAGDVSNRGQMLRAAHRLCKVDGHVVVVLPLACLENARYMTHKHFQDMMTSLGFDVIMSHNSRKLSFKLFRKTDRPPQKKEKFPKKELRAGTKLNNFSIVLR